MLALLVLGAVAVALFLELRRAHDRADREAEHRRRAELACVHACEGLIAAERDRGHALGIAKGHRTRGDELEILLHQANMKLVDAGLEPVGEGMPSAMKRILNHAGGAELARGDGDPAAVRPRGDHPTNPGIAPPRIFDDGAEA